MPTQTIFNGKAPANAADARDALCKYYDSVHAEFSQMAMTDETRAKIEKCIINSHIEFLLLNEKKKIAAHRKLLLSIWHSDKAKSFTPAMQFLENVLGADHCYKLVEICVDRIKKNKEPFSIDIDVDNISEDKSSEIVNDIIAKSFSAPTYSERLFYKSLISLVKNSSKYVDDVSGAQSGAIKLAAVIAPLLGGAYCIYFFTNEILLGIGVSRLMSYYSNRLERSSKPSDQARGIKIKEWADHLLYLTGSVPAMIISGNYAVAHQIAGGLINSIGFLTGAEKPASDATQNQIQSIPLRLIAAPLEKYVADQQKQIAAGYREGASKSLIIKSVICEIEKISQRQDTLAEKLDKVSAILASTSVSPVIVSSGANAKKAIQLATEELERARLSLTSAEDRCYYESYHGMRLPLRQYLADYSAQWVASWRKNAAAAKLIKATVTAIDDLNVRGDLDKDTKLRRMGNELHDLRDQADHDHVDVRALNAISAALAAVPQVAKPAPMASYGDMD